MTVIAAVKTVMNFLRFFSRGSGRINQPLSDSPCATMASFLRAMRMLANRDEQKITKK